MADIRCMVKESAQTSRQQTGLLTGDREILYSEYDQCVAGSLGRLRRAGVKPGELVAVRLPNDWQTAVLLMALFRARAVACLVDPALDKETVLARLSAVDCRRMIAAEPHWESPRLNLMNPDDLMALYPETPESDEDTRLTADQPATITWSVSRAILHSYGNHYYGARGFNHHAKVVSGSRCLLSSPLYRMDGLQILFQSVAGGAALVLPDARESLSEAIVRYGVTHLVISPAELEQLLNDGFTAKRYPSVRALFVNGLVGDELGLRIHDLKLSIRRCLGVPEAASPVAAGPVDTPPGKQLTSGKMGRYCRARIASNGEILLKGQSLCLGYMERTLVRRAVDDDGWFATGDIGSLDAEEYLMVTRLRDRGD